MALTAHQTAHDDSATTAEISRLQASHGQPVPLTGQLIERQRRRRLDLRTLHGVARESGKIYRQLASGQLQPAQAEVRSRVLRRHSEILNTLETARIGREFDEFRNRQQNPPQIGADYGTDGAEAPPNAETTP